MRSWRHARGRSADRQQKRARCNQGGSNSQESKPTVKQGDCRVFLLRTNHARLTCCTWILILAIRARLGLFYAYLHGDTHGAALLVNTA
jgi:hypothetical protein